MKAEDTPGYKKKDGVGRADVENTGMAQTKGARITSPA